MRVYFLQWRGKKTWPCDRTGLMMYAWEVDKIDLTFDLKEAEEWLLECSHGACTIVHIDLEDVS